MDRGGSLPVQRLEEGLRPARFSWFSKNCAAAVRVGADGTDLSSGACGSGSGEEEGVTFSAEGDGGVSKFCKIWNSPKGSIKKPPKIYKKS